MSEQITLQEAEALLEGATVKFSNYYKYMFTFKGEHNGIKIVASIGGDADDAYGQNVIADREVSVLEECGLEDSAWRYLTLTRDGEEIFRHKSKWAY